MKADPSVSIVLATYNPNIKWFGELLISIEEQTFQNFELLIYDDNSQETIFKQIEKFTRDKSQIQLFQNKKNEGSNRIFEKLVEKAIGDYIAFCDQDDIWEKEKLEKLLKRMEKEHASMVYSDMSVIDAEGKLLYKSLKEKRKRLFYRKGRNLAVFYLFSNCTAGCSMIVKREIAKKAIPFPEDMICDQWIAAYAAAAGRVSFEPKPLVRYRQHGKNQSGILKGVYTKENYLHIRVIPTLNAVREMRKRQIHYAKEKEAYEFAFARYHGDIRGIWKHRRICKKYAYFETLMWILPEKIIDYLLKKIREE